MDPHSLIIVAVAWLEGWAMLIWIVVAVAWLVGWAMLIGRLAAEKGYDRTTWVVLGLLFDLAALIIVLVLPTRLPTRFPPGDADL